jgi:hypothetical protein
MPAAPMPVRIIDAIAHGSLRLPAQLEELLPRILCAPRFSLMSILSRRKTFCLWHRPIKSVEFEAMVDGGLISIIFIRKPALAPRWAHGAGNAISMPASCRPDLLVSEHPYDHEHGKDDYNGEQMPSV